MHLSVHCNTVYDSQDMEATWMSIDRGRAKEDVVHTYNGILLSHSKEWSNVATWMDLEIVILNEVSQTEKKKYQVTFLIYGI